MSFNKRHVHVFFAASGGKSLFLCCGGHGRHSTGKKCLRAAVGSEVSEKLAHRVC